jgi:L-2-hydroxyglutarate oxidase LhgO
MSQINIPQKDNSYWMKSTQATALLPHVKGDVSVDVAIVGGGIAGLSAAYFLKKAGRSVAVIEKESIGSGTTGHTTGKVTSQHNVIYSDLINRFGTKKRECMERRIKQLSGR